MSGAFDPSLIAVGRRKQRAVLWSLCSNGGACLAKIVLAGLTGSTAVLAEAAHSGSDLLASTIALLAIRKAAVPADPSHPFGHEKFENVSGLAEGLVIVLVSVAVVVTSLLRFGDDAEQRGLGIAVMLVAAGLNLFVSLHIARVARETESAALDAESAHLRTDVYTSLGVAVALVGVAATGVRELDQLTAIAIALFTGSIGVRIVSGGVRALVDEAVPPEEVHAIRQVLEDAAPQGVRGFHRLRARRSGSTRHVDVHLTVDQGLSVGEAHRITDAIEAEIERRLSDADVVIHVEPDTHRPEGDSSLL